VKKVSHILADLDRLLNDPVISNTVCNALIRGDIDRAMTPELALALVEAGVNFERIGLGLLPIDFSDSIG
jgi:hypothetical protein